ncbi:MAG TPA: sulfate adenylyltransferase, partial [Myxococcota bacterium]|nr:sulfate adenylyltransferase [Myxococcota bacterium]
MPVHGGLADLVDRRVPLGERGRFVREADRLPSVRVTRADLSTVHRIADGALSPLQGPMRAEQWNGVLDAKCIEVGGHRYAWAIPLALPVTSDEAASLSRGGSVALRDEAGGVVGIVDELECFEWDKARYVEKVYRTRRFDHPGGRAVEGDPRDKLLGGALRALPQPVDPDYGEYMLSPRITRALIRERKWERALAFQTRNPLHRAHEYALVVGLERLTREGHLAGAVLNPLVGETKGDDVDAATRMRTYRALIERNALGEGDMDEELWKKVGRNFHDHV